MDRNSERAKETQRAKGNLHIQMSHQHFVGMWNPQNLGHAIHHHRFQRGFPSPFPGNDPTLGVAKFYKLFNNCTVVTHEVVLIVVDVVAPIHEEPVSGTFWGGTTMKGVAIHVQRECVAMDNIFIETTGRVRITGHKHRLRHKDRTERVSEGRNARNEDMAPSRIAQKTGLCMDSLSLLEVGRE